jgi:hypothetical protein
LKRRPPVEISEILGHSVSETEERLVKTGLGVVAVVGGPERLVVNSYGSLLPNCVRLSSYQPRVGDRVLYLVLRSGEIVVLGMIF